MQLLSFQNKEVLKKLLAGETYYADIKRVSPNKVKPYEYMRSYYKWDHCPVFCMPCGSEGTRYGGAIDECVLLGLDVPKGDVRIQYFYDWSDVIYFMEFGDEFATTFDTNKFPTVNDFANLVMAGVDQGSYSIFQATIPCIKPEWLVGSLADEGQLKSILSDIETKAVPYLDTLGMHSVRETAFFT